jgi:hypothetical protein
LACFILEVRGPVFWLIFTRIGWHPHRFYIQDFLLFL